MKRESYLSRNWDLLGLWMLILLSFLIILISFMRIVVINLNLFRSVLIFILIFAAIGLLRNIFMKNLRKNFLRWILLITPLLLLFILSTIARGLQI